MSNATDAEVDLLAALGAPSCGPREVEALRMYVGGQVADELESLRLKVAESDIRTLKLADQIIRIVDRDEGITIQQMADRIIDVIDGDGQALPLGKESARKLAFIFLGQLQREVNLYKKYADRIEFLNRHRGFNLHGRKHINDVIDPAMEGEKR